MEASATRAELLDAAAEEFLARGFAASTMAAIAARRGLTKGALAYHFPTKRSFAAALMDELAPAVMRAGEDARRAYPDSGCHAVVTFFLSLGLSAVRDLRVAAAATLLLDRGSPDVDIAESIALWNEQVGPLIELAADRGDATVTVPAGQIAEHLLLVNLAATVLQPKLPAPTTRPRRLTSLRRSLTIVGFHDVDAAVDDVLSTHAEGVLDALPPRNGSARSGPVA